MSLVDEETETTTSTTTTTQSQSQSQPSQLPSIPFLTKSYLSDRRDDLRLLGEDAAIFNIEKERWGTVGSDGWSSFTVAVAAIMAAVIVTWVLPGTGYSDDMIHYLETRVCDNNSHLVTLSLGLIFPVVHSGLASLRPHGERVVGARVWRVLFAFPSLCLAYTWITYFISHAHDGVQFYDISHVPPAHAVAWCMNYVSFFFLSPSVFNLKEVAAVDRPTYHLWETGMIRITRHPQLVGQALWSTAHLAMVGTSFTALTMALLVGHHVFASWNGDRRYEAFFGPQVWTEQVRARTSVVPFVAVWEGRQILPPDYYKELLRGPYFLIAAGTLGAYLAHPYMQAGAAMVTNAGWVPGGIFG
jgi:zeta-carotene isomerase